MARAEDDDDGTTDDDCMMRRSRNGMDTRGHTLPEYAEFTAFPHAAGQRVLGETLVTEGPQRGGSKRTRVHVPDPYQHLAPESTVRRSWQGASCLTESTARKVLSPQTPSAESTDALLPGPET